MSSQKKVDLNSPALLGSIFQSVMDPNVRRMSGVHYTNEENILKVIRPLFLNDLRNEFEKVRSDKTLLNEFHDKLGALRFFDPASGCGNFLVLAYRELRRLEMEIFESLLQLSQPCWDTAFYFRINLDQFYGIEMDELPVRIAERTLQLMYHQMNREVSERFGTCDVRLPLQQSANIVLGNALRRDWNEVLPKEHCSYIFGNPPFVGGKFQDDQQRSDMQRVFGQAAKRGLLDYVSCWFFKAAEYIQETSIRVGFVSTNSIVQGEQVGVLWSLLLAKGIKINFAYQPFVWTSETSGKAHVHCVIIGFCVVPSFPKYLYSTVVSPTSPGCVGVHSGTMLKEERISTLECPPLTTIRKVSHINPYLVEGPDVMITHRTSPMGDIPEIRLGNQPIDGGHFILTAYARQQFLEQCPQSRPFLRPFLGSEEFLHGRERWCIWLHGVDAKTIQSMPVLRDRVAAVRAFRLSSKRPVTRALAEKAMEFAFISHPEQSYLLIPGVSSEKRDYIPIGFVDSTTIASNATLIIPGAELYHFGVLTSRMHNVWTRRVCGRLESRYRYSAKIVYNNFPWMENLTTTQQAAIEEKARVILEVRQAHSQSTLAVLYDPLSVPAELLKAHRELDWVVDRAYRQEPFGSDEDRLAFLLELYEQGSNGCSPNPSLRIRYTK